MSYTLYSSKIADSNIALSCSIFSGAEGW